MRNIIIGLIAVLFINSCSDDFVNTQPLGELAETAVWTDGLAHLPKPPVE